MNIKYYALIRGGSDTIIQVSNDKDYLLAIADNYSDCCIASGLTQIRKATRQHIHGDKYHYKYGIKQIKDKCIYFN